MKYYLRIDNEGCFGNRWFRGIDELKEYVIETLEESLSEEDKDENGKLLQKHVDNLNSEKELISWMNQWNFYVDIFDDETDEGIEKIWGDLEDVPFDEDKNKEMVLGVDWFIFEVGTSRTEIWHWFDEKHTKGVSYLLYGEDCNKNNKEVI